MSAVIEEKSGRRRSTNTGRFMHKPQPEAPGSLATIPAACTPVLERTSTPMAIFEAEDTHYRGVVDDRRVAAEVTRMVQLAVRQGRDPAEVGAWLRELSKDAGATILD
jgi:hypothetical protein